MFVRLLESFLSNVTTTLYKGDLSSPMRIKKVLVTILKEEE
ncbi:hypothetical protein [Asaccharospora irregularis]